MMKRPQALTLSLASLLLAVSGPANAAITYVDAVEGANTFATGGSPGDTSWLNTGTTGSDPDQWVRRSPFANGGVVLQAWHSAEDVPELTTTMGGLADGPYEVWAFFWDASGSNTWGIDAGLTSGDLTTYSFDGAGDTTSPVAAGTLDFDGSPLVTEDDRILYGVNLGTSTVVGGSEIEVFIDNSGGGSNNRTWFDGVGYEPVPEPSSMVLLAFSGLMVVRRRRA